MIAKLSYSLYLIHMAVILLVQKIFSAWGISKDSNLMFALSIIFCIALALILHYSIEKPFMKMRERFLKPAKQSQSQMQVAFLEAKT